MLTREVLRDIVEWDVPTWKRALSFWEQHASDLTGTRVLEIGARNGGLSLYFALKGCRVACSDLTGPTPKAVELHRKHRVSQNITYKNIDATAMAFEDGLFDLVCFKSILGGIGRNDNYQNQRRAVCEMHRVLKPGGLLLFAENARASRLHACLRSRLVRWGKSWRYVSLEEIHDLFAPFDQVELASYGFFAAFGRSEIQRSFLHVLDVLADPFIRDRDKYMVYGCARKGVG